MITSGDQQHTEAGIVPNKTGPIPTQYAINDLCRELEFDNTDLSWRAASMIARLELALIKASLQPNGD